MNVYVSVLRNRSIERQLINYGVRRSPLAPVSSTGVTKSRFSAISMWFAVVLFGLLGFLPTHAWASCSFVSGFFTVPLTASFTGSITVGRDVPIGTELYRSQAISSTKSTINCDALSVFNYFYTATPLPASGYTSPAYGNQPIYRTNVAGIGVVAWAGSPSQAFPANFNSVEAGRNYSWGVHSFYYSLVKTANVVGAGTITASSLPVVQYRIGSNNLTVEQGRAAGSVNVVARTCTTPDVNVPMGTRLTSELNGVGSFTSSVDVPIALNNCPAFFGTHDTLNSDGTVTNSVRSSNSISYQLDPTTSVVNQSQGIFALRSGGATGMGIQILNSAGVPVALSSRLSSGLSLTQTDGMNYTISLLARYYQTQATITPGAANSSLTVTLTYL